MTSVTMHIKDPSIRLVAQALLDAAGCTVVAEGGDVRLFDSVAAARSAGYARPTLVLCAYDELAAAVAAMREGLYGYVLLPFVPGELALMVHRAANNALGAAAPTPKNEKLCDVEREHINFVMREAKHNQAEAARRLGIGRNTLWRKLKQMEKESAEGDTARGKT